MSVTDTEEVEVEILGPNNDHQEVVTDVSPKQLANRVGVPAQMIYNYIQSNRIPSFLNDRGKKRIKINDADEWAEEYIANKMKREAARAKKLKAELEGGTSTDED